MKNDLRTAMIRISNAACAADSKIADLYHRTWDEAYRYADQILCVSRADAEDRAQSAALDAVVEAVQRDPALRAAHMEAQ